MTPEEEIQRGHEAQRLMEEPMVRAAFSNIETGLLNSMKMCAVADVETQHRLVLTYQLLENFKRFFQDAMATGKMAKQQIVDLNTDSLTKRAARSLRRIG